MPSQSALLSLPFSHISNIDFYETIESVENYIKSCLQEQNFPKYINSLVPQHSLFNTPCNYYTTQEFSNKYPSKPDTKNNELRLLHHNIRSLDAHYGELLALLHSLGNNFDFIALSEIGTINIKERGAQLEKHGYKLEHQPTSLAKGGVGLIYRDDIDLTERTDLKIKSIKTINSELVVEDLWYETNFSDTKNNYVIGVIYKHPGCTVECLDHFTKQIELNMAKINNENKKCIITGDINIDGLKVNLNTGDNHTNKFFKAVLEQNFIPTITLPTRIFNNQISLIDHIFTNLHTFKQENNVITGNIYSGITDHLPNFIIIKTEHKSTKRDRPMIRIFSDENIKKFQSLIAQESWEEFYTTKDVNKVVDTFYTIYNKAFYTAFPLKKLSRKRSKDTKWITTGLKASIHHKDNLYKKSLLKPSVENKLQFANFRNLLTTCLRKAEDSYYRELITSGNQNLHKLWNIFGKVINPNKNKSKNKINKLVYKNKILVDDKDIANAFNEHFSTVGENLAEKLNNIKSTPSSSSYRKYLKNENKNPNNFFLFPTNTQEITEEINKLSPKKSAGADNISPKLLIACNNIMTEPIAHIINLSFENATVPDQFKIAKVIPIYKKNDKFIPDNYRPISLLSTLNKIMEKLMYRRIITFLDKHNILYRYQFGFRQNHSTSMALMEIVDCIYNDLEKGKYVTGIFLDMSKAFDTVHHAILIDKLKFYGIRGQALTWFESYLNNRKQFTSVNQTNSKLQTVKYGVPQGSVLGPLLFLLYTNDMVHCTTEENQTRLFADDSNSFISRDTPEELKNSMTIVLKDLFEWCRLNKLTVNIQKTCFTVFKTSRMKIPNFLDNLTIENYTIPRVPSAKYLGVILDENLNWEEHIEHLNKSLTKTGNSFKIIKHQVHPENKHVLYYAYIYSKIQYGIEVYGRAKLTSIKKVQTQQNRSLKILFNKDYFTPTIKLHTDLNLLLVRDIYKLSIAKFVYKQKNQILPEIFNNLFTENYEIHNHNTRQCGKLHVGHQKTKLESLKTKHQGTEIWNSIPSTIQNCTTTKSFSKNVKNLLLSYQELL